MTIEQIHLWTDALLVDGGATPGVFLFAVPWLGSHPNVSLMDQGLDLMNTALF